MLKYLNYVLSFLHSNNIYSGVLPDEINIYKEYWLKYNADNSISPLYNSIPDECDCHCFILPTNEKIFIRWDIEQLYQIVGSNIHHISLAMFENLIEMDLKNTTEEISRIHNLVNTLHNHRHVPILLLHFKPTNNFIILDGRHRYIEYKKFKQHTNLPVYILNDEQCFTSIIYKKDLLSYIILHNIEVINSFILGKESLTKLLNLKKCLE